MVLLPRHFGHVALHIVLPFGVMLLTFNQTQMMPLRIKLSSRILAAQSLRRLDSNKKRRTEVTFRPPLNHFFSQDFAAYCLIESYRSFFFKSPHDLRRSFRDFLHHVVRIDHWRHDTVFNRLEVW